MIRAIVIAVAALGLIASAASASAQDWGAVLVSPDGGYGWSIDNWTEDDALDDAMDGCGGACTDGFSFQGGCGAIAIDEYSGLWYWGTGLFQDFAESSAIESCLGDGGGNCYIEVWACNS